MHGKKEIRNRRARIGADGAFFEKEQGSEVKGGETWIVA
jgi:hypothetical protein